MVSRRGSIGSAAWLRRSNTPSRHGRSSDAICASPCKSTCTQYTRPARRSSTTLGCSNRHALLYVVAVQGIHAVNDASGRAGAGARSTYAGRGALGGAEVAGVLFVWLSEGSSWSTSRAVWIATCSSSTHVGCRLSSASMLLEEGPGSWLGFRDAPGGKSGGSCWPRGGSMVMGKGSPRGPLLVAHTSSTTVTRVLRWCTSSKLSTQLSAMCWS